MDGVEALARPNALDSERTRLLKQAGVVDNLTTNKTICH